MRKTEMNKPRTKLIAYWNQYKLVLKEVPIAQEYYISESYHIDRADDGSIACKHFDYMRCKIDHFNTDLRGIKAVNLERYSLEYLDYLCAKYKIRFVR